MSMSVLRVASWFCCCCSEAAFISDSSRGLRFSSVSGRVGQEEESARFGVRVRRRAPGMGIRLGRAASNIANGRRREFEGESASLHTK